MEATSPQISVIIPVYNIETYLPRCLNSILSQTFSDFEVLLIDDGSTDKSGIVCDEYALKDKRIRVLHKENGGVSSARNMGLDNAKGKWISFIDGDDYISEDFLFLGDTNGIDVIQKSYTTKMPNEYEHFCPVKEGVIKNKEELFKFYVQKRDNALWNKIISFDIIRNKRFDENISIGEDFLFFLSLLSDINVYKFDKTGTYFYNVRDTSAMHSIDSNKRLNILFQNIAHVKRITNLQGISNIGNSIISTTYVNSIWSLRGLLNYDQRQTFRKIIQQLSIRDLRYITKIQRISFLIKKLIYLLFY